jgi:hypothetical protein
VLAGRAEFANWFVGQRTVASRTEVGRALYVGRGSDRERHELHERERADYRRIRKPFSMCFRVVRVFCGLFWIGCCSVAGYARRDFIRRACMADVSSIRRKCCGENGRFFVMQLCMEFVSGEHLATPGSWVWLTFAIFLRPLRPSHGPQLFWRWNFAVIADVNCPRQMVSPTTTIQQMKFASCGATRTKLRLRARSSGLAFIRIVNEHAGRKCPLCGEET